MLDCVILPSSALASENDPEFQRTSTRSSDLEKMEEGGQRNQTSFFPGINLFSTPEIKEKKDYERLVTS